MPKSNSSNNSRQANRPQKPYAGFPLNTHPSGRWSKKIRQQVYYFGRWGVKSGSQVVPVEDFEQSAADALAEFNRQWPYLKDGRTPPDKDANTAGCTIRDLCNEFLTAKQSRLESGELSLHTFAEYRRICERILEHFGRNTLTPGLTPADFEAFRRSLAKGVDLVTLGSKVNRARVVFKFAFDAKLIDRPVEFGTSFDKPSAKALRINKQAKGEKLFSRSELLLILDALDGKPIVVEGREKPFQLRDAATLKAMFLLGLNGGFGNTDVASLPRKAIDLATGWIRFPRPKTGVDRRVPLWPETREALAEALKIQTVPVDPQDAGLAFLTIHGTRFVRIQESKTTPGRHVTINALSRRFESVLANLGVDHQKGRGFYTLRHQFETIGGDCRDQVAVDFVMGHSDGSMAENYRQRIDDSRLVAVVDTVRRWLWPDRL